MKLYIYDHCPFCCRVCMIVGLKQLPIEIVTLLNDDEITPINLVGKKMVPIFDDGKGVVMPESLDIVQYLDQHYGEPILTHIVRPEIQAFIDNIAKPAFRLVSPRFEKLGLDEFKTQSAWDYYRHKKESIIGDFVENLAESAEFIAQINPLLTELALQLRPNKQQVDLEDILLFPVLRNLTAVKGLEFPANVKAYLADFSKRTNIPLFFDRAI